VPFSISWRACSSGGPGSAAAASSCPGAPDCLPRPLAGAGAGPCALKPRVAGGALRSPCSTLLRARSARMLMLLMMSSRRLCGRFGSSRQFLPHAIDDSVFFSFLWPPDTYNRRIAKVLGEQLGIGRSWLRHGRRCIGSVVGHQGRVATRPRLASVGRHCGAHRGEQSSTTAFRGRMAAAACRPSDPRQQTFGCRLRSQVGMLSRHIDNVSSCYVPGSSRWCNR
jgi:hypothetical protein